MKYKLLLGLVLLLLLSVSVSADLNTGLQAYWNFQNTSMIDIATGLHNGSTTGAEEVAGIIGNSLYIAESESNSINIAYWNFTQGNNWTVCGWIMSFTSNNATSLLSQYQNSDDRWHLYTGNQDTGAYSELNGNDNSPYGISATPKANEWQYYCYIQNGAGSSPYISVYQNGTFLGNVSNRLLPSYNGIFRVGKYNDVDRRTQRTDEMGIWSRTLTSAEVTELYNGGLGLTYPFTGATANFTVTAISNWTSAPLSEFNVSITNSTETTNYTTTTGQINTPTPANFTELVNITVTAPGRFPQTYIDYNVSTNLQASMKQSDIKFTIQNPITLEVLAGNVSISSLTQTNSTSFFLDAGAYVANATVAGYNVGSNNITISALQNETLVINATPRAQLNISIRGIFGSAGAINGFNATITNTPFGFSSTNIVASGNFTSFNLTQNISYNVTIQAPNYITQTFNLPNNVTAESQNIILVLYAVNSINFTIRDELTQEIITSVNTTVELIGSAASYNYSVNGSRFLDLLTPQQYTIRYSAPGYVTRLSSYLLVSNTTGEITLYLTTATNLTDVMATVVNDIDGQVVSGATIKILKFSLVSNSFILTQQLLTDNDGKALMQLYYNQEYYIFVIEYPAGDVRLTTDPSYIYSTTILFRVPISTATNTSYITTTGTVYWNNITNQFSCTWNKPDSTSVSIQMITNKITNGIISVDNTVTGSGGAGVVYSTISSYSNLSRYTANCYGDGVLLDSLSVEPATQTITDITTGMILLLLFTIAIAFIAAASPIIAIIAVPLGIIIFVYVGLVPVTVVSMSAAAGLMLAGVVVGFLLNRRAN